MTTTYKRTYLALVLSGAALLLIGQGCATTTSTDSADTSADVEQQESAAATVYDVGEDAAAGDIVHRIDSVEVLDVIPSSRTLEAFANIAEDEPAGEGNEYVYLTGTVTNNGAESATIKSISVNIFDDNENEYRVATNLARFVDLDRLPVAVEVPADGSAEWEGYFLIPSDATGLRFVGTDLQFLPDYEVTIDLGIN